MLQPSEFPYDVFLSHSSKDKPVVREIEERLREAGLRLWFDEWELPVAASRQSAALSSQDQTQEATDGGALPRRRYAGMIEEGPYHFGFRISDFGFAQPGMSAQAFGSDWAQLEAGTCGRRNLRFRDPLNQERRFIPLRLDDARIRGSLAQFLYVNWLPEAGEQEARLEGVFNS